ncbi:MAG: DUF3575 domain-containing protein [Barnesiella sp.]|nr:DUF3575 domain-containing protein [Barnesiella sp.]
MPFCTQKKRFFWLSLHTLLLALSVHATAQDVELRTNLLYWMTTTPNAGVDVRLSDHITIGASLGYNAFNFSTSTGRGNNSLNPKIHHWSVMPEGRWWFGTPYRGSFLSLHILCGEFNAGGISFPEFLKNHRYRGYAVGAGMSYGHVWNMGRDWRIGVSAGLSLVRLDYKRYNCGSCGSYTGSYVKYIPLIPVGISVAYVIPVCKNSTVHLQQPVEPLATIPQDATADSIPPTLSQSEPDIAVDDVNIADETALTAPVAVTVETDTLYVVIRHEVDSSTLSGSEASRIDSLLSAVKGREITQVTVSGYASPEYNAEHNRRLSLRRAIGVADYMTSFHNIPASLITTNGYGDDWDGLFGILSGIKDIELTPLVCQNQNERKRMIRRLKNYNYILTAIYPMLRRTEVVIIVK